MVLTDINAAMLKRGRDRVMMQVTSAAVQCDAEHLPFQDSSFDCVSVAFGLRNMTDKLRALTEMHRVRTARRTPARARVLHVRQPLQRLYDAYSFNVIPRLGKLITDDSESYRYLAESIRMHPDQEQLKTLLEQRASSGSNTSISAPASWRCIGATAYKPLAPQYHFQGQSADVFFIFRAGNRPKVQL